MSFNFSQTAGTSGITIITVSATSREELTDLTKFYTLANVVTEVNMPISQRAYEPLEKYINFQPSAITWSNSGGTANLTITSNDEWYIVADGWIQLTRLSDMTEEPQTLSGNGNSVIGIRCYENVGSARTGGITGYCVSNSAISATTTVQQSGGYEKPYLYLSQYQYPVEASGYTGCSVSVYSNLDWTTISDARWIVVNTLSGSNDGTLLFDVQHSEQIVDRIGTITVSSTTENISVDLNVLQSATTLDPYLYVTPTTNIVPMSGGELTLSVSSNTSWETSIQYSGDSRSWISLSDLNGDGDMDVTVRVDAIIETYSATSRNATIKFYNELYGLEIECTIGQLKDANLTRIYYTTTGGTIVTPNEPYGTGPYTGWGANIVSNTYENGIGVITFDNTVTTIPNLAFNGKEELNFIMLPESVETIGSFAFAKTSLVDFTIPDSVEQVLRGAFLSSSTLNEMTIGLNCSTVGEPSYAAIDCNLSHPNTLIIRTRNVNDINTDRTNTTTYDLNVIFEDTVETIGNGVFSGSYLTNVQFNTTGLTYIGPGSFNYCRIKNDLILPEGLEYIGYTSGTSTGSCFSIAGTFTAVTIPSTVKRITNHSFSNCINVKEIYCYAPTQPYIHNSYPKIFEYSTNGTLHYPHGSNYSTFISALPSSWTAVDDL